MISILQKLSEADVSGVEAVLYEISPYLDDLILHPDGSRVVSALLKYGKQTVQIKVAGTLQSKVSTVALLRWCVESKFKALLRANSHQ